MSTRLDIDWRNWKPIPGNVFDSSPQEVAPFIVGCMLLFDGIGGIIVETEAYDQTDPASHSYRGCTPGNRSMFGPPAHAYVYRSYGVHWCLNFVCGPEGYGSAVLIRAIEPIVGLEKMQQRRGLQDPRLLCSGPGRLTQALGISGQHDGLPLDQHPFVLLQPPVPQSIATGPRIGINKAVEKPWRYGLAGSKFLSRPFPRRPG